MRKALLILASALALPSMLAHAQEMNPTQAPPGMEQKADPAMPATQPEDPNADVPPAPVANDPLMEPAPPGTPQNPAARPGSAANPIVEGGNMTPPPPPMDHYPICGGDIQDSCMNPRAAPPGYGRK